MMKTTTLRPDARHAQRPADEFIRPARWAWALAWTALIGVMVWGQVARFL